MAVTEDQLDALYGEPLEQFTAARNALARELRDGGDSRGASTVKKLKKPTRAAWLVNQLARRKRRDVERLLATGEELRDLQEQMAAGSVDAEKLRKAAAREQAQIDGLLKSASAIGREHEVGSAILDRVADTLKAASGDTGIAETVRAGRLEREGRASGIGLGAVSARPRGGRGAAEPGAAKRKAAREEAKRRERAERKLASAEQRLARAEHALNRALSVAREREETLRKATRERDAARRELKELG